VGICCNSVIVAVAMERLDGRDATLRDAWAIVRGRLDAVLRWAFVSATIGIVLRLIQERTGLVGVIATWIGNLAWALATFFVVPVLLFEPVEVRGAIRTSARVFRDRWGEQVTAQLAIGAGFGLDHGLVHPQRDLHGRAVPLRGERRGATGHDGGGPRVGHQASAAAVRSRTHAIVFHPAASRRPSVRRVDPTLARVPAPSGRAGKGENRGQGPLRRRRAPADRRGAAADARHGGPARSLR
jgi:hypothetical protein